MRYTHFIFYYSNSTQDWAQTGHNSDWYLDDVCSLQDLRIHRNEIHSKLVAIMRERLTANLKQLPGTAAAWGTGAPGRKQPSAFAQTNAKQLRILCQASCNDSQTLLAFLLHCKQSCITFVSHPHLQHKALLLE